MKLAVKAALLGGIVASLLFSAIPGCAAPPTTPPNVLLIVVDDLRPQIGAYGQTQMISPNMDRLASQGLRFDRAYTQEAVCGPSRVSLLSGVRARGAWELPRQQEQAELATLPHLFRLNGVQTVSVGKLYHRLSDDPHGWSQAPWMPWDRFPSWHAYVDPASLAIHTNRSSGEPNKKKREMLGGPPYEAPDVADDVYPDGMIAVRAIEELRRLKDAPFFLGVGFVKPHLPFNAPKKYWDLYDPEQIQLPEVTELPQGAPAHALQYLIEWRELRRYAGIPAEGPLPERTARKLIHGYYACVSYVDAQIGRVLAELERLGLRENTIIVLWGDHGWKLGEYSAWSKHTNYEIDTRTPLVLSVPGQKSAGTVSSALVEAVDVGPTLAELSGFDVPRHWEGTSMVPLIADPARAWKTAAFSRDRAELDGVSAQGYSVRTKDWRYTEWISDGKLVDRELYDHRQEAMETRNVAEHAANAEIVAELSRLLAKGEGWQEVRQRLDRDNE